ncbi:MlaD family protein [Rhodobacter sp. CZR27]|uniref:MlaD family protein n=1 Tax=Rhodobacter sp. CZR27 TaxID=2033869 RepID=UPI000BBE4801|nr:MlaD family protein [Rhodobacter sp. CZR27]
METRARYVLIGLFTLLSVVATLGFLLWLAKVQLDRTYTLYDILFESVEGLGRASPVRYNGVDVGEVLTIGVYEENPALVRVRIQLSATTPVRTDTKAQVASQGVTGVSYVSLSGGAAPEPLEPEEGESVAVIPSERSAVQALTADAPTLLAEAIRLLKDIQTFTGEANREAVASILTNADASMQNLAVITRDTTEATARLNEFAGRLDGIADRAEVALGTLETTLTEAKGAASAARDTFESVDRVVREDVPPMVDQIGRAVESVERSLAGIRNFADNGLPKYEILATETRRMVGNFNSLLAQISRDPARFFLGNQTPSYRR